jgi:hypothetical protein
MVPQELATRMDKAVGAADDALADLATVFSVAAESFLSGAPTSPEKALAWLRAWERIIQIREEIVQLSQGQIPDPLEIVGGDRTTRVD